MENQKIANFEIKKINRNSVYRVLIKHGDLSKQDIVAKTGLCLPTVTQNIEYLCDAGLVEIAGSVGNTGGRKARSYGIVKDAKTAIGVDITRNHITVAILDLAGNIIQKKRIRKAFKAEDGYYHTLADLVEQIIIETNCDRDRILGVGIGVPALISEDHQVMTNGEKLGCTGLSCGELAKYVALPSKLFNDSNSAAFSEAWGRENLGDAFYLMLSESVGGAYLFGEGTGESLRHSEIGHSTLIPGGKMCYCGKAGCSNAYCMASVLSQLTDNNLEQFFFRLKENDPQAKKLWNEYLKNLSYLVSNIRVIMQCKVIIGGYVGAYIDDYIDDLRQLTLQRNFFDDDGDYIIPCKYKNESIAAGAALPYIEEFLKSI